MIYGDLKTVPSRSINDLVTKFNVSVLAPFFSGGTTPNVLRQIVSAIYHPPFGEV